MAARPIIILLALTCAPSVAGASPRTDPTIGRSVFTGATVNHPTSITLNPAALGLGLNNEFYVAATGTLDAFGIDTQRLDAAGQLTAGASVTDTQPGLGGILAVVLHPTARYAVSFELKAPPPEVFPTDHEALRYFTLGGRQRDYLASIGSTIKVTGGLYFGATLTHHNTDLRLRYARDAAAETGDVSGDCGGAPCGYANPEATERYDVTAASPWLSTSNLKVTLGFLVRLYRDIWLGVAYHTPPGFNIQTALEGDIAVERAPRDGGARVRGDSVILASYPASVDAEVRARLPQLLDLHVGGRWEDLSRMQAYDVRAVGSTIVPEGIPEWMLRARGMHDAFALWAGVEQVDFGQRIRFGARIGFETSSVTPDRTTPLTIAPASLTLDLGGQLRLGPWIAQLSYGLQYFRPVDVTSSDFDPRYHADCIASGFDYSTAACRAVRNGYAVATGAGDYRRMFHAVRLGFRYEWD